MDQERSEEVGRFLDQILSERLSITDFSFHSIGVVMSRLNQIEALLRFIRDIFVDGSVALIHLEPEDTQKIAQAIDQFKLDFDDAYQYVAAEKDNLTLVSFDSDFDRTKRRRKTPAEILNIVEKS